MQAQLLGRAGSEIALNRSLTSYSLDVYRKHFTPLTVIFFINGIVITHSQLLKREISDVELNDISTPYDLNIHQQHTPFFH